MNKESAFSVEYDVKNTTNSQEKTSTPQDEKDVLKKIESDYKLSKPRRNLIRARIILK